MKVLIITKPVFDFIFPLVDFPKDGDKYIIENSTMTINTVCSILAVILGNSNIDVSITGVVGNDENGNNIKKIFENNKIDTKYIETSFQEKSCVNYKIYNTKTNKFTTINQNSIKTNLLKYKYDFVPDVVIMDDSDYGANMAALNNFPNAKFIYVADKFSNLSTVYLNKCDYVISNTNFICNVTGVFKDLNKPKVIVNMFQKFIDLYKANIIVKLDNFDFIYIYNDEVRIIKNINDKLKNKDNLYVSLLCYFLLNTNNIEESIKYTNKVMLSSGNELDMFKNIPELSLLNNMLKELNSRIKNNIETLDNVSNENVQKGDSNNGQL